MGLYLLSTVVAHDFGWIGVLETVERLEATLQTMTKLRRVRGHFCNWYDTRDLRPLEPIYVSTVDSGNLAGHLIALSQACRDLMQRPPFGPEVLRGLRDALQLVRDSVEKGRAFPAHADDLGGAAARGRSGNVGRSGRSSYVPPRMGRTARGVGGPGGESSGHRSRALERQRRRDPSRGPDLGRGGSGHRPQPHPRSRDDHSRSGDGPRTPSLGPRTARRRNGPGHGLSVPLRLFA